GADRFDDIPRIEADRGQDHADQDRQQDKLSDHGQRRAAQKAVNELVGVCLLFRHRNLRSRHLAKLLHQAQAQPASLSYRGPTRTVALASQVALSCAPASIWVLLKDISWPRSRIEPPFRQRSTTISANK